jgi:hypothetical protein
VPRAGRQAAPALGGNAAVEGLSFIAKDYLYGSAASRKPSPEIEGEDDDDDGQDRQHQCQG